MVQLPTGTVTFLFTDIEGSTRLWEQHPEAMRQALARHDALLTDAIEQHGGTVVKSRGEGDSFFAVFARATDALAAALALQQSLLDETGGQSDGAPGRGGAGPTGQEWRPDPVRLPAAPSPHLPVPLRVRVALHTGEAEFRGGDYYGAAVSRCARLRAAGRGGQVLLSLAAQELVRDHLPEGTALRDLGQCRLKDLARPEQVFQLLHPALPDDFPPLRTLDVRPNNLPAQPTPLIGREWELETVRGLLRREEVRLVTLTGPGGTGKTRLGLQVAADLHDDLSDGVFFVALAPISDPGLVASAISQTLGVREMGDTPVLESLKFYLREKQLLLLLDNFEQLLAAAPLVTELLASCPRLKVLVTSRAVLHLRGEKEFAVPSLALPDPRRPTSLSGLSQYAAVQLFIPRALDVKADFGVTHENAPAVAAICRRLDGLPLAIELAAARIKLLPPEALLSRLESRLKLLTGGARDLPARQQTLRKTIAWSYELLDQGERRLFQRLAVFVGGCTLEAAETVCSGADDLEEVNVFDGMTALADKSLMRQETGGGEPRFMMLETIREYALERLAEGDEAETLRRRHARFFIALAEEAEPRMEFGGPAEAAWRQRLEAEHDNLRAALDWAVATGQTGVGLRLAGALEWFWLTQGYTQEGLRRLAAVLAMPRAAEPTPSRAKALRAAGWLEYQHHTGSGASMLDESLALERQFGNKARIAATLYRLGAVLGDGDGDDRERARQLLEECLANLRELGDRQGMTGPLRILGMLQNDPEAARTLLRESLAIHRQFGERSGMAWSMWAMGRVARRHGDLGAARRCMEEALMLFREAKSKIGIACVLQWLGSVTLEAGDGEAARSYSEEALALYRDLGDKNLADELVVRLGHGARHQGHAAEATSYYREALRQHQEHGDRRRTAECLEGLAEVARMQAQPERAVRLFAAAQMIARSGKNGDASVAELRAQLPEEAFEKAWAEGRAMPPAEAIYYALEEPSDA